MIPMFKILYDWDLTWTPTQLIIYDWTTLTTMQSFNLQHMADPIQHSKPQTNIFEMFW